MSFGSRRIFGIVGWVVPSQAFNELTVVPALLATSLKRGAVCLGDALSSPIAWHLAQYCWAYRAPAWGLADSSAATLASAVEYSVCSAAIKCTFCARRIVSGPHVTVAVVPEPHRRCHLLAPALHSWCPNGRQGRKDLRRANSGQSSKPPPEFMGHLPSGPLGKQRFKIGDLSAIHFVASFGKWRASPKFGARSRTTGYISGQCIILRKRGRGTRAGVS